MPPQRFRTYSGGRGSSSGGGGMTLSFPPFTPAIKWLIIVNVAIFLVQKLLQSVSIDVYHNVMIWFSLIPQTVIQHGWVWQLITYGFLHEGIGHIFFNMLTLWFVGAMLEQDWRARRFLQLYFFSMIGGALTSIALSYTYQLSLSPRTATVGASGAIYGVLIAFAMLYGEMEFWMFPLPFRIKAKYLAAIWILVAVVGSLIGGGNVAYIAHLGGIFFGFAFVKLFGRRGISFSFSERYFGLMNSYHRWKRRRMARKFEVYMNKQGGKQARIFDDYGNYIGPGTDSPPDEDDKGNGKGKGHSGWVN